MGLQNPSLLNPRTVVRQETPPQDTDLLWLDSSTSPATLRQYDGSNWTPVASKSVTAQEGQPSAPADGDVWIDTTNAPYPIRVFEVGIGWETISWENLSDKPTYPYENESIADNSIDSSKIIEESILGNDIANTTIGPQKLWDSAIRTVKIQDNAVTTAKISNGSVTTPKINAVTEPESYEGGTVSQNINDDIFIPEESSETSDWYDVDNVTSEAVIIKGDSSHGGGNVTLDRIQAEKIDGSIITVFNGTTTFLDSTQTETYYHNPMDVDRYRITVSNAGAFSSHDFNLRDLSIQATTVGNHRHNI